MSGFLDGLLRVRIAPGADLSAASSTWTFEDITSFVRFDQSISIDHGKRNEGSDVETAILRLAADNRAGTAGGRFSRLNPTGTWFGELSRNTPIEVAVQDASVWHNRFSGFASFTPRWNEAGKADAFAVVNAYGILHRLSQDGQALRSPLYRSLSTNPLVVAYWPCEDGRDATQAFSPIAGVSPWSMAGVFAAVDGPPGSDQLVRVVTGTPATLARVPNHTPDDVYVAQVAWRMDEDESAGRSMLDVRTTSADLARWVVRITDTTFNVLAWDDEGASVIDATESLDHSLFGQWLRVELRFWTNGTSVSWDARMVTADAEAVELNSVSGSEVNSVKGRITQVGVTRGTWTQDRYFGHLAVLTGSIFELPRHDLTTPLSNEDRHAPYHGWTGELAADRFERLCEEEGLTCSIVSPTGGLRELTGVNADNASTPDAAALDITGDIDLRGWIAPTDWADGNSRSIIDKWETTGDQRSYMLQLGNDGEILLIWSTDGTVGTISTIGSNEVLAPLPADGNLLAVRATLDVNNGAAGHDVNIYFGPSLDGPWTLHYSETIAGTTSIHAGTAALKVLGRGNSTPFGLIREARVYSGIAGTPVASPNFAAQTVGAASFDDAQGNTWTVNGDAAIVRADDTTPMGPQQIDTLVANLRDVATADQGRLGESGFGIQYRTHSSLLNQTAALAIPAGGMDRMPHPDDSTQQLRNHITVNRHAGSSALAVDDTSIDSEGRFPETVTANMFTDDDTQQLAYWRLHVGTIEEYRWPQLHFALHRNPALVDEWLALAQGDRVTAVHDFDELSSGISIDVLAEGWSERITGEFLWFVTINGSPAGIHDVAVFDTARFDAAASTTSGSFVAGTGTSLTVATAAGSRPWVNSTDHAAEFPFHIKVDGVVLNVTAISGATSPQTFTVDATTVNGVTKTIASGSAVRLADTPTFAL